MPGDGLDVQLLCLLHAAQRCSERCHSHQASQGLRVLLGISLLAVAHQLLAHLKGHLQVALCLMDVHHALCRVKGARVAPPESLNAAISGFNEGLLGAFELAGVEVEGRKIEAGVQRVRVVGPQLLLSAVAGPKVQIQGLLPLAEVVQVHRQVVHRAQRVEMLLAIDLDGTLQGLAQQRSRLLRGRRELLQLERQLGGRVHRLLAVLPVLLLHVHQLPAGLRHSILTSA
mmetsp:Transcript_13268/g.31459  ORF Transcript_13268/g.31459 Transcript_13268/m.31459 type:complete len:229 (+) Transcript_13268:1083-1769(+)